MILYVKLLNSNNRFYKLQVISEYKMVKNGNKELLDCSKFSTKTEIYGFSIKCEENVINVSDDGLSTKLKSSNKLYEYLFSNEFLY